MGDVEELQALIKAQSASAKEPIAMHGVPDIGLETLLGEGAKVGAETTVSGIAQNCSDGAVIIDDRGRYIAIDGLAAWEDDAVGKRFTVTGTVAPDDVLQEATWEIAP